MGIVTWVFAAVLAFAVARGLASGRRAGWLAEAALALTATAVLGLGATALDFGGWDEPDWRAGFFVLTGTFAAIGMLRFAIVYRSQP